MFNRKLFVIEISFKKNHSDALKSKICHKVIIDLKSFMNEKVKVSIADTPV